MDGSELVAAPTEPVVARSTASSVPTVSVEQAASEPTLVMAKPKKRRPLIWIGVILLLLLLLGIPAVGILVYSYNRGMIGSNNAVDHRADVPVRSSPPKRTPTPESSPTASPTPDDNDTEEPVSSEEMTPITWSTTVATFDTTDGKIFRFSCPPDGTTGTVWGSDVYTTDSSICMAAVHAGKITAEAGGEVEVKVTAGRQTYGATTRHGITSFNYGKFPHSFVFVDSSAPPKN